MLFVYSSRVNKKNVLYLLIGVASIALLIYLYGAADPISPNNKGFAYQIEQAVKAGITILLAWFVTRLIAVFCWAPLEAKQGRPVSRVLKDLELVFVYAIAAIFILANIYGKSATGVWAAMISAAMGLAYVGQDYVKDCIASVIMDFMGVMKEGDWVELPGGKTVKVNHISFLETEFKGLNEKVFAMSNSKVLDADIVNYSDCEDGYFEELSVTLDPSVPVDRARRILAAAAASAPGVLEKQTKVFAKDVENGCITYRVLFKIAGFLDRNAALHHVVQQVTEHLRTHCISLAETTCRLYRGDDRVLSFNETHITTALETVKMSPLFQECSLEEQEKISHFLKQKRYKVGEILIAEKTTGDTMLFLAEGKVEVSIQIPKDGDSESTETVKKHITYLVTNDFFGEGGVLQDSPRNATVSADTDALVYELRREDLKTILKENPEITLKISVFLVARRQATAGIANEALHDMQERKKLTKEFASALKNFLGL